MLNFINVSSFSIARVSASLGDKGLFSTANILKIGDVIHQVDNRLAVLAMFLTNSPPVSSLWNERNVPPFCTH